MFYYLYLVIDIYSRKFIAWEVSELQNELLVSLMIRKAFIRERVKRGELFIHADNGGPMKGATMLVTLRQLSVVPSFNRSNVSDDNAFSEALFRTLKYRSSYPKRPLASLEEAKVWVFDFVSSYNSEHLHSGIGYVTPNTRHNQDDARILEFRKSTYEHKLASEIPHVGSGKFAIGIRFPLFR